MGGLVFWVAAAIGALLGAIIGWLLGESVLWLIVGLIVGAIVAMGLLRVGGGSGIEAEGEPESMYEDHRQRVGSDRGRSRRRRRGSR